MFKIHKVTPEATAAVSITNIDKPRSGQVILKRIHCYTTAVGGLAFAKWYGWLFLRGKSDERMALYNKIVPQSLLTPVILYDGSAEWLENWRLTMYARTQTASEKLKYTIFYELLEKKDPQKRIWW